MLIPDRGHETFVKNIIIERLLYSMARREVCGKINRETDKDTSNTFIAVSSFGERPR